MTTKPIVAGTDGSEESLRAVEWAAREATLRGTALRIVSAADLLPRMIGRQGVPDIDTVADVIRKNRDQALAMAADQVAMMFPSVLVDTEELSGTPAHAVTESGAGALMLVVGSRGGGAFTAMVLGSVGRYAAAHASCPVVVVREETASAHRQIGVGVGNPEDCTAALAFAFEEAALRKASVIAVHAWHSSQPGVSRAGEPSPVSRSHAAEAWAARQLEDLLADWQAKYPDVPVSQYVVRGHPGRALAGLSARADLLVIGRHTAREHGLRGPGAARHAVLNHAHGPVVTVPSPKAHGNVRQDSGAVDHSKISERAVVAARDLAVLSKGEVRVLHLRETRNGRQGRHGATGRDGRRSHNSMAVRGPAPHGHDPAACSGAAAVSSRLLARRVSSDLNVSTATLRINSLSSPAPSGPKGAR
jgi:nucleotide-binding universal stress UspA family protein